MKEYIIRNAKGRKIIILFTVTMIFYAIMLAVTIPLVMSEAGGMKLLDMMPMGYTFEYVSMLMAALGTEGRFAYMFYQIPFDMIYPALFGITWSLVFTYFLKKTGKHGSGLFLISILPFIAAIADYLENFSIIVILSTWPDTSEVIAKAANLFSIIKSTSTTLYFTCLIILLIVVVYRYFRTRFVTIHP